jgi:hypothetical protein
MVCSKFNLASSTAVAGEVTEHHEAKDPAASRAARREMPAECWRLSVGWLLLIPLFVDKAAP